MDSNDGDQVAGKQDLERKQVHEAVVNIAISTATYPLLCCKTLAQLGYEPQAAVPVRTIFGCERLCYPNLFSYASFMLRREGLTLFSGLSAKLMCTSLQSAVKFNSKKKMNELFKVKEDEYNRNWEDFFRFVGAESAAVCISGIASQPLRVIMVRQIAYLIGKEEAYSSLLSTVKEIYSGEGITGFFSGLIPQLIADLLTLWLLHLFTSICTGQLANSDDPTRRAYEKASTVGSSLLAGQLTYPLQLVAVNMSVTGSRLSVGEPLYRSWFDCYRELGRAASLKRGSAMFLRYKPIVKESYV